MAIQYKLIIFDLDGVLVSTKDIHYKSLNNALPKEYAISREEHLNRYDGLPTRKKLDMLTKEKGLPVELHEGIYNKKQHSTFDIIRNNTKKDQRLINVLKELKDDGYSIFVASNAIRETVKLLLYYSGLMEYVDRYYSNQDVVNKKPDSEIYLRCMIDAGVNPEEVLIIEDSPTGIEGAIKSGGRLLIVEKPESVTYEKIIYSMSDKQKKEKLKLPEWNILIPMAGLGSRFEQVGYTFPKPLIEVFGKPMIQVVVENLGIEANYIYIVRKEHYDKYSLKSLLNILTPNCTIIQESTALRGAAYTTLLAKEYINNDNPLLIANSDQFMEWSPIEFYYKMIETKADAGFLTFKSSHPKWSYVELDDNENVIKVAEKDPISNHATTGVYWSKKGSDYVKYAEQMIEQEIRVNGEFYVAPVFNEFIKSDKKIKTFDVDRMWGMGDPSSLEYFLNNYKC